tara:strand:+ start:719 stop:1156 length:438 start_codon:yes stop_codon:yes gene_type:complete
MFSNEIFKFINNFSILFKVSGCAFLLNILIYTFFKRYIGINLSAIIAEISGSILLYFLLKFFRKAKLKKKRHGILLQSLIALMTLIINLLVLNTLDLIVNNTSLIILKSIFTFNQYSFLSKLISSSIGFIWTSTMTMKFNFYLKK